MDFGNLARPQRGIAAGGVLCVAGAGCRRIRARRAHAPRGYRGGTEPIRGWEHRGTATVLRSRPQTRFTAETEAEFYRRKKSSVVVRHASGDRIVAIIEIMSPGNKSNRHAFQTFLDKACELLEHRIHLLIIDPLPRGPRDPNGVHGAIWEQVQDDPFPPLPRPAVDPGRLRVRPHDAGLHRARGGRSATPGHAPVSGTQWVCHGAPGGDLSRRRSPSCPEGGVSCSNLPLPQ